MAKRPKEDKKRSKRKEAAKQRKEHNKAITSAFFKITGSFPFDMRQEIQRMIVRHPYTNKQWKSAANNPAFLVLLDSMFKTSANPDAFARYFPRYAIGWSIRSDHCIVWPYRTERVFLDDQICYKLLDTIKLPLSGGHQIVFTKHAMERMVQRYFEESMNVVPTAPQISLLYPLIMVDLSNADFEVTYIDDEPHLHCYGHFDLEHQRYFGRGHFPIVYKEGLAVAKTFLYDKWLGSTVEN